MSFPLSDSSSTLKPGSDGKDTNLADLEKSGTMTHAAQKVLDTCIYILEDIKSSKGFYFLPTQENTEAADVWSFYRSVLAEYTSIEKAIQTGENSRVRSSNCKYLLEVWKVAKSVPHVYAVQRFFPCGPTSEAKRWSNRSQRNRSVDTAPSIQIEVVAGDVCRTRYFLKVSTIDEKRLGHDLVRAQWDELDSEAEEEDECNDEKSHDEDEYISQIPVAVTARQLISAAEMAGTTPILILPYLSKGKDQGFFKYLDSLGLRYHCQSDEYPIFNYAPGVPTAQSPNVPPRRISLDITTLLSIVADVCNMPPNSIQYDKDTCPQVDQTEWEARAPTLPGIIFPYLATADELITPPSIVTKMNKLLETIGSDAEKKRAAILFGTAKVTNESLMEQYNHLTIYPLPPDIPLPISVVPVQEDFVSPLSQEELEKLSGEAADVYSLALSIPEGSELATANKQLAKMVRTYYFVERNRMGVGGRVLLHQPRSLRGFGKIVHLPMKQLITNSAELSE